MTGAESNLWAAAGAAFFIGGLIGVLIGYLLGKRARDGGETLAAKKAEADYREKVSEHFVGTAGLVDGLTDSYKALFDHLQSGAGDLLDEETLRERLASDEKVITLQRLGQTAAFGAGMAVPGADAAPADSPTAEESFGEEPVADAPAPEASDELTDEATKSDETAAPEEEVEDSEISVADSEEPIAETSESTNPVEKTSGDNTIEGEAGGAEAEDPASEAIAPESDNSEADGELQAEPDPNAPRPDAAPTEESSETADPIDKSDRSN